MAAFVAFKSTRQDKTWPQGHLLVSLRALEAGDLYLAVTLDFIQAMT